MHLTSHLPAAWDLLLLRVPARHFLLLRSYKQRRVTHERTGRFSRESRDERKEGASAESRPTRSSETDTTKSQVSRKLCWVCSRPLCRARPQFCGPEDKHQSSIMHHEQPRAAKKSSPRPQAPGAFQPCRPLGGPASASPGARGREVPVRRGAVPFASRTGPGIWSYL